MKWSISEIIHLQHLQPQYRYEYFHIHFTSFHCTGRYELNKFDLAPNVWLHSSVGGASHRYRGGHGFSSLWSPDIFRASSFQLLKLEKFTAMITLHLPSKWSSGKLVPKNFSKTLVLYYNSTNDICIPVMPSCKVRTTKEKWGMNCKCCKAHLNMENALYKCNKLINSLIKLIKNELNWINYH